MTNEQPKAAHNLIYEKGWREGYNRAIEEAIKVALAERHNREMADEIRKLKK